jgi:hypothetical protein
MPISERFIHEDLVAKAEAIVLTVKDTWRKHRKIDPYVITWPSEELKADDGSTITHAVFCALPEKSDAARMQAVQQLVERTKAYGLLVVEQKDHAILVMFETRFGARSWYTPLAWHGDIQVPGQTEAKNNADAVGLLWRTGSRH